MIKGDYLTTILNSNKTVFTLKDIAILWHESNTKIIRDRLYYYVRNGDLYKIRRGFYAKNNKYQKLELANRLFTPSYISFETVLAKEGLIFQYQAAITIASYLNRTLTIEDQIYSYRKVKDPILLDPSGLIISDEVSVAGKERAFLDTLYNSPAFHFDNLRALHWEKVFSILPIYQNQRLNKYVEDLHKQEAVKE